MKYIIEEDHGCVYRKKLGDGGYDKIAYAPLSSDGSFFSDEFSTVEEVPEDRRERLEEICHDLLGLGRGNTRV